MRRVEAGTGQQPPLGTFLSPELNALAVIAPDDGGITWTCGAAPAVPLTPISVPDTWRMPHGVLTVERDDNGAVRAVSVSAARMRHLHFDRYDPDGRDRAARPESFPTGFPVPFGGPRLPVV